MTTMQSITFNTSTMPAMTTTNTGGGGAAGMIQNQLLQQQQLFALASAAATAATIHAQIISTTRVEILGQYGPFKVLGKISPFMNQTICNCTKVAIDRHPARAVQARGGQKENDLEQASASLFPPNDAWTSFCDDVDKELQATNFAKSLATSGSILILLVEIVLFVVMAFAGVTFGLYVFFLPFIPVLILAYKVRSMTLKTVEQVRNVCEVHSSKSNGGFRYILNEEVVVRRVSSNDSTTMMKTYYITVNAMDPSAIGAGAATGGNLGNMGMGGATSNSQNVVGGHASIFDQLRQPRPDM